MTSTERVEAIEKKVTERIGAGFTFEVKDFTSYTRFLTIKTKYHLNLEYKVIIFRGEIKSFSVNGKEVHDSVSDGPIEDEMIISYMKLVETTIDLTVDAFNEMVRAF